MTASDHRPSLVFGIVAATGAHIEPFADVLSDLLRRYGYDPVPIRLTTLLLEHVIEPNSLAWRDEGERLQKLMSAGDALRAQLQRNDAMALLGALGIAAARRERSLGAPRAYILRQLKHPEEVFTLRRIYGDRLFVLSLYSTYGERLQHLTAVKNLSEDAAKRLMRRDEEDVENDHGQRTRDAFELGDVFLRADGSHRRAHKELGRFLDLVFGCPVLSPFPHEHAMYLAYAASLRSADLSRQVGAAIASAHGDIVALGANDVPAPGGGPYWPEGGDQRDHARGHDSNSAHKLKIARDIFERANPARKDDPEAFQGFIAAIADGLLFDITEYGRAVHAEMDALLACARSGIPTRGARLFSTTFPCHNCAKHLVSAGIAEVQYVEAYPKSMARELHGDAIDWEEAAGPHEAVSSSDDHGRPGPRVVFRHYVGIGPRRYLDLFSLTLGSGPRIKRKQRDGKLIPWDRATAIPRVPSEAPAAELEGLAIAELNRALRGSA